MSKALTEAAKDMLKPKAGHADEPKKLGGDVPLSAQAPETPTGGSKPTVPTSKTTPPGKTPPSGENMKSVPNTMQTGSYSSDTPATSGDRKLKDGVNKEEDDDELYESFEIGDLVEDTEGNTGTVTAITEEGIEVDWELNEEPKESFSIDNLDFDLTEDVNAMLAGDNDLSEEFKEKVKTIFEAAVKTKVTEYASKLDEMFNEKLDEAVETAVSVVSESVETYLDHAVQNWIAENEVAIQSNLRTELTEDFINGLRNLFIENYIDVPEEKIDIVEELSVKVEELEGKLNEEIERNINMEKILKESKKQEILHKLTEGLVDAQKEKIISLSENVEFKDEETFEKAISTIKENYFPENSKPKRGQRDLDETSLTVDSEGNVLNTNLNENNDPMDKYVRTLNRQRLAN